MNTWREIVYMVLDLIKAESNDAIVTEEHVIFLAKNYRIFLLEQEKLKNKLLKLSESNYQEVCLDLELVDAVPGLACGELYLKSVQEIPDMIDNSLAKIYPIDLFNTNITYVSEDRFKFVGYNKYMANILYATIGTDNHLYIKSNNPLFKYLEEVKLKGIFEDAEEAAELSCDKKEEGECPDMLDKDFPLEAKFIPVLIELLVKDLLNFYMRPKEGWNNSNDDMADLISYVRRNMKSDLAKQLTD